jgi:hypothetical protein
MTEKAAGPSGSGAILSKDLWRRFIISLQMICSGGVLHLQVQAALPPAYNSVPARHNWRSPCFSVWHTDCLAPLTE